MHRVRGVQNEKMSTTHNLLAMCDKTTLKKQFYSLAVVGDECDVIRAFTFT